MDLSTRLTEAEPSTRGNHMNAFAYRTVFLFLLMGATQQPSAEPQPQAGFRALVGYRYLDMGFKFNHDTHPQDAFLSGAGQPGSAGTTRLGPLNLLAIGVGYQAPVAQSLILNLDIGGLVGTDRDRIKNANDNRPDANAAFIYSESSWGLFGTAGLSYAFRNGLSAGIEAQVAGVSIESGWDRYGVDQAQKKTFESNVTIGPKLGYRFNERASIEASAQIGKVNGYSLNAVFHF